MHMGWEGLVFDVVLKWKFPKRFKRRSEGVVKYLLLAKRQAYKDEFQIYHMKTMNALV